MKGTLNGGKERLIIYSFRGVMTGQRDHIAIITFDKLSNEFFNLRGLFLYKYIQKAVLVKFYGFRFIKRDESSFLSVFQRYSVKNENKIGLEL